MSAPYATVRLQFNAGFTFDDAVKRIDYFARLGISHLYASPLLQARPGSTHGYDVVDPSTVNRELGGEVALRRLAAGLHERGMGLIADIVPNHLGIGPDNPWWQNVLAAGRRSQYARIFDIDWHADGGDGKSRLLLPVLAEPLGDALRLGKLSVDTMTADGEVPCLCYEGIRFPLARSTWSDAGAAHTADALWHLLEHQHYRLAWWPTARDDLNWRRFFDITSLAAVRAEDAAVFAATHALLLHLYADSIIDGVRVDHVDGIADPGAYCRRLRRALQRAGRRSPYIVVEKILAPGETLRPAWQVDGTTGYDFMNDVTGVLHDGDGVRGLTALWHEISKDSRDFDAHVVDARRQVLAESFGSELRRAVRSLHQVALGEPAACDFSAGAIQRCVSALAVHFPVYRIYEEARERDEQNEPFIRHAVGFATADVHPLDRSVLAWLASRLNGPPPRTPVRARRLTQARARFAQLTASLAAKAMEDTAGYRYGRLLSRNEVGSDPAALSESIDMFHARNVARVTTFPNGLLATATHDHKRGEDVRSRLAVLSELPETWATQVRQWMSANAHWHRPTGAVAMAPTPADEYLLYQTLVGAWPMALSPDDASGIEYLVERVAAWQIKALREAKQHTCWLAPEAEYEDAGSAFLHTIMQEPTFVASLAAFVRHIAPAGAVNSLVQTLLRMTCPGVPDLYQGCEFWDHSLVDPDNRRAVDYVARQAALDGLSAISSPEAMTSLLAQWHDGRIKLALISQALAARRAYVELFRSGSYQPFMCDGPLARHVIAFARYTKEAGQAAVVVTCRLTARWVAGTQIPLISPECWGNTMAILPPAWRNRARRWRNLLTGEIHVTSEAGRWPLREVLSILPVALLVSDD